MISSAACGLQGGRGNVDVWMSVKFDLLCSLGHVTSAGAGSGNEGWAGGEGSDSGDIEVRGDTVLIQKNISMRACSTDRLAKG